MPTLPLMHEGGQVTEQGLRRLVERWRATGHNLETGDRQSPAQGAEMLALEALIDQTLFPATQHYLWLDEANYSAATFPAVAAQLRFPLQMLVPASYKKMSARATDGATEDELLAAADRCLTRLEGRLGEAPYFFGERATYLDALVYGYVAVLRVVKVPNRWLGNAVKSRPKLNLLCDRIERLHFHGVARTQDRAKKASEDGDALSVIRKNAEAVSVALGAMTLFGLYIVMRAVRS